jgi:hypothetical protein
VSDGRNRLIIITDGGDLGGSVYYQLTPADAEKIVFLRNSLSGSQDLILFQGTYNAARDLIVPAGKDVIIKFSGGGTSNAVVAPVFADLSLDAATIASADINGGTIDGVTIGVTSVATVINVDNLKLDGNTLSSTDTNGNVVLAPNGDGDVQLDADTVRVGDSNNDVTITTNGTGDLTLNTNGGTDSGSIEIQDGANTNIIVTANGTGKLELANGDITTSASSGSDAAGQDLTIQAGASTGNAAGGDMVFQTTPAGAGSGTNLNSYTTVLTLTDDSKMQIGTSTAVNSILDEDDMNSDSDTALATQQSIKAYVDSQVGTVDTWSEVLANGNTSGATDAVITAGQKITTDTIEETTADAGVKVDTFTLKDNEVSIDAASGTDQAGTDVTVSSGQGTGTGAGGELLFKVAPAGSTGSSVNALATGMKLDSTKALYVDTINELTSAAGVTIDSVLLKDDVVNATDIETSTISANDGTTAINIADSTGAVDIDTSLNVDGTVTADGLTVDGVGSITSDVSSDTDILTFVGTSWGDGELLSVPFKRGSNILGKISVAAAGAGQSGVMRLYTGSGGTSTERIKIESNGDITFFENDGTTASFVYDANAGTTFNDNQGARDFTVKSDNNAAMLYVDGTNDLVGIGGTPQEMLDLLANNNGATENNTLRFTDTDTATQSGQNSGTIEFYTSDTDGAGVHATIFAEATGIGGSGSIVAKSGAAGSLVENIRMRGDKTVINDGNADADFQVKSENQDDAIFVDAANDTVGFFTTDSAPADSASAEGTAVIGNGQLQVSKNGATPMKVNRIGTDGDLVRFHKGGSSNLVGKVGTASNYMYLGDGNGATGAGLHFVDSAIRPYDAKNISSSDAEISLGVSAARFNNLYLANAVVQDGVKATTTATTQVAIETFAHADHDGAKVVITAATSADTYVTELLIATNGTTAVATEYGQIGTGSALATYDVDISGANVRILATPASTTSTTFRVAMTLT